MNRSAIPLAVALAFVDQFTGVVELLWREFRLAPEFHTAPPRGPHSGAGAFADKVVFLPSLGAR